MSAVSFLETLVKETKCSFIIAKFDGTLDACEIIKIAVEVAQKIQKFAGLSGPENKAMLLHALTKGLETSGGLDTLPQFKDATQEMKQAFEDQIIKIASTCIDVALSASSGKLNFIKPSCWMNCVCPKVLSAKDSAILAEATKAFGGAVVAAAVPAPAVAAPVAAAPAAAVAAATAAEPCLDLPGTATV